MQTNGPLLKDIDKNFLENRFGPLKLTTGQ